MTIGCLAAILRQLDQDEELVIEITIAVLELVRNGLQSKDRKLLCDFKQNMQIQFSVLSLKPL